MLKHWRNTLLLSAAAILLFGSCKKKSSPDDPLPINYNPSIIIGSNNSIIYALDPVTGKRNWEYGLRGTTVTIPIKASPLVYNEMVYVIAVGSDTLYKLNSKTGALVKKIVIDPSEIQPGPGAYATPVADNGLIYIAGLNSKVYAIDTGTGKSKWTYNTGDNGDATGIESSPVIHNGKIYFATKGGWVYCLDKTLGGTLTDVPFTVTQPIWTLGIAGASFHSSPAIAAPYLYIGSLTDSNMYCIYLDEPTIPIAHIGIVRWKYKTKGPIMSSPAAYHGRCIFGCNDFAVYCLDTSINPPTKMSPDSIWIQHTGGRVTSSPYVYNQVVYVGNDNAFIYALNIINGGVKWQFQSSGAVISSPLLYNGVVYAASSDKNLYAIDSAVGTLKWYFAVNGIIECSPAIDNLTGAQFNSQISGLTN